MGQELLENGEVIPITSKLIDQLIKSLPGLDGTPLALLLPYESGKRSIEMVSSGLKQLENSSPGIIVVISPLRDKHKQIVSHGSKILIKELIKFSTGKAEIEMGPSYQLANKLKVQQIENEEEFLIDQLPVLQFLVRVCPNAKIISILIGATEFKRALEIGNFIAAELSPFSPVLIAIGNLDTQGIAEVEYCDCVRFQDYTETKLAKYANKIVTYAPIIAALAYTNKSGGYHFTKIAQYLDSKSPEQNPLSIMTAMFWDYRPPELNFSQKDELIKIGFSAIKEYLNSGKVPICKPRDEMFERKSGVFITIRQNSILRGCIGKMNADEHLYKAIQSMSIAAATSDPRFPALSPTELHQTDLKIAILSPIQRIAIEDIEVGKHGLLIVHQGRRGVLLPEVPIERGWDKHTFLRHLCIKAGLNPEIIDDNPNIYGFTTIQFGNSFINSFSNL